MAKRFTFHLIANAHLDPVWLWDWRDGLNEGIITCRTILDLMDEFEELTFMRGESMIYRHIAEQDPATFRRIARQVAAGRWEVVGGTPIQPDTNLPAVETFVRLYGEGQRYFRSVFGKQVQVAWAADSFGHAAGLPTVMAHAGITGFAFTRPFPADLPLPKPAFWWEGPDGSRVLAYRPVAGWYGSERDEMPRRLDAILAAAAGGDLRNVGVFYGLGNHGGGPSRRQLRDIAAWAAAHPEVEVIHSGLHRLCDSLAAEAAVRGDAFLPTHRGELNFCLRGCYASAARFKFAYRRAEAALASAERTDAVIRASRREPPADLSAAWEAVLFNTFHDILPGSSIERAYEDQLAWLGRAVHDSQKTQLAALNALAREIDTTVPAGRGADHPTPVAVLAWNPHPWPFKGHLEMEANMDYRPIAGYRHRGGELPLEVRDHGGRRLPFQSVATEHSAMPDVPWRKRVVVPAALPALGWGVFTFGWVEGAKAPAAAGPVCRRIRNGIANERFTVTARPGGGGVRILRDGRPLLGSPGLGAIVVEDPWGSWGGPERSEATNLSQVAERWQVQLSEVVEAGPERALLWVRLAGERSRIDLSFHLYRGRDAVDVSARVFWNERYRRLKLTLPAAAAAADYEVPGDVLRRGACGEVPGGRWVRVHGTSGPTLGFASDSLYCFDLHKGALRPSVVRSTGYAHHPERPAPPRVPVTDQGELRFRFLLTAGDAPLPQLAQALEQPPEIIMAVPSAGRLPRGGSLAELHPASLQLLALKPSDDGRDLVLRVQETTGRAVNGRLEWLGQRMELGIVDGRSIATWRLTRRGTQWRPERIALPE